MGAFKDLKGTRIGFLVVEERLKKVNQWGAVEWKCKCDCGNYNILNSSAIKRKSVISCSVQCEFRINISREKSFNSKIVKDQNGCWIWIGHRDKDGYGVMAWGGRGSQPIRAHRFSYERNKGKIPEGMYVCHSCDCPSCINPDHLWLGTAKENYNDSKNKKRNTTGERQSKAKLTAKKSQDIRDRYKKGGVSLRQIAEIYGVKHSTIYNIIIEKTWKNTS